MPIPNRLNSLVFHPDTLGRYDVAQEMNLIFVETTLFQVGIQPVFPQNIQYPLNGVNMGLSRALRVNKNIIQIYDDKDIELLGHNLVDIALKTCWSVG